MSEKKTSGRRVAATLKQAQAMRLRIAGMTFEEIARELGYSGPSSAHKAVVTGLRKTLAEPAAELRALYRARQEALLQAIWPAARQGDLRAVATAEKIIMDMAALDGLLQPRATLDGELRIELRWSKAEDAG